MAVLDFTDYLVFLASFAGVLCDLCVPKVLFQLAPRCLKERRSNRKVREEEPQRSRRGTNCVEQLDLIAEFLDFTIILFFLAFFAGVLCDLCVPKVLFQFAPRCFRLNEKYAKNGIPDRMTSSPYPEFGQSFLKV
jgi:hypothetical protein